MQGLDLSGVGMAQAGHGLNYQPDDLLGSKQPHMSDRQRPAAPNALAVWRAGMRPIEAMGEAATDRPEG
jgi:hypothetical protein